MKNIILIPAYEPDEKLIEVLKSIKLNKQEKFDIVVVDDGSGEPYKKIFDTAKEYAVVLSYEKNMGKGHALKIGLKYIRDNYTGEYIVVTMDSDGQHKVEDAIKLAQYSLENKNDLVLGKRRRGKHTPIRSKIGNEITRLVFKTLTAVDVYDTQTGLRAFSNDLIDLMLSTEGDRYEYEMNVLLKCSGIGIRIYEVEIETIYVDNNSGSHFNSVKDSTRIYWQILKFSASSFISFIIDYVLYSIFLILFDNTIVANVIARLISATANYSINRKVVFGEKGKLYKSLIKYVTLVIVNLALNTALLSAFVYLLGMNAFISKVIVEIVLFLFSWVIQKKFVFIH